MYDNRYESHVTTGMTQELTFGRVTNNIIFVFKFKREEAPAIYHQLDEERCQWCSFHYYIQVKPLGSL